MTLSTWLTLASSFGQVALIALVLRTRHAVARPLAALMVNLLLWNLAWLAFAHAGAVTWSVVSMSVATTIPAVGFECILAFVGKTRAVPRLRRGVWLYFGVIAASSASQILPPSSELFVGKLAWRVGCVSGIVTISLLGLRMLLAHYRSHPSRQERAHTWTVIGAGLCGVLVAATDLVHDHVSSVPQLSNLGTLVCALGMAAVVLREPRLAGETRPGFAWRMGLFALSTSVVALVVLGLLVRALAPATAMTIARVALLCAVTVAILREVVATWVARRERLAELALLGRFTAQLSHDLKNPIAAAKGALQYVAEERRQGRAGDDEEFLLLVEQQIARLEEIVDRYERVAKVEARLVVVDVVSLVRETVTPLARTRPDVDVRWQIDANPPACEADRELLARAIENAVGNALDAMPEGGTLEVAVTAELSDGDPRFLLRIRDDGEGMDARICERVFDDFFTTKSCGSGLGLAFVRRVAEAHGGDVSLTSRLGRGTELALRLPLPVASSEAPWSSWGPVSTQPA